jgi:AcrR family transcriptional regulator/DNA-binding MarR family transcriptional regulator
MVSATKAPGELRVPVRRSSGSAQGSDRGVDALQRGRLLSATFALVGERGYEGVTVRGVCERAGVSSRVFYRSFSDREDCFLAAFNDAIEGLEMEVRAGWESELGWTARIRAALRALLVALDREPVLGRLVFVEALAAGPRVLACRARVLEALAGVVDRGRVNARVASRLPVVVGEGVVGGAFGVIHARLLELRPQPLVELLGQLMATIVLPYRGSAAAARELARPGRSGRRGASRSGSNGPARPAWGASHVSDRLSPDGGGRRDAPPIVVSTRRQMALAAVAGRPGLNNREVSEIIGLGDQGQISRMMKRLSEQGLVENTQAHTKRLARAWRLTADGEAVIDAHRSLKQAQRTTSKGGKLIAKSTRRGEHKRVATAGEETVSTGVRVTALTHEVLTAVATLGEGTHVPPSNVDISRAAGVKDQGQISKLLARLQAQGLLRNTGGATAGIPNAWQLTPHGEALLHASRAATPKAAR